SSVRPGGGPFGTIGVAAAALRNYAMALNADLADRGVHAAHVAIGVWIGGAGEGTDPAVIAEHHWNAHAKRDVAEIIHAPGAAFATGLDKPNPAKQKQSAPSPIAVFKIANKLVEPLLASRLHKPLSGRLMLLTYQGRKTGREYTV